MGKGYIWTPISNGEFRKQWLQFRTTDWVNYLEYPEYTNKGVNRFLNFQPLGQLHAF